MNVDVEAGESEIDADAAVVREGTEELYISVLYLD